MPRPVDLRDCSRASIEAQADHLRHDIAGGRTDLKLLLEEVEAQIPHALEYDIDHRDRDCRRS